MLLSPLLLLALLPPVVAVAAATRAVSRLRAGVDRGYAPAAVPGATAQAPACVWVLSAAHDEAANLPAWLEALQGQRDLAPPLRPVLADDGSTDGGPAWAREQGAALVFLPGPRRGKLAALQRAIAHVLAHGADGDAVLFTDADCRVAPGWARAHVRALSAGFGLVVGHMDVRPVGGGPGRDRLRRLESGLSSLQSALGAVRGRPAFARGGNWSTTVARLRAAGGLAGLEDRGSGDDILLPRRILATGAASAALTGPDGWIETAEPNGAAIEAQSRRRRYSKTAALEPAQRRSQLALLLAGALLALFPALAWREPGLLAAWAGSLLLLALASASVLHRGLALYGLRPTAVDGLRLLRMPLWALQGRLRRGGGRYTWKERDLSGPAA